MVENEDDVSDADRPIRGRARSHSFRSEEEELTQRGIVCNETLSNDIPSTSDAIINSEGSVTQTFPSDSSQNSSHTSILRDKSSEAQNHSQAAAESNVNFNERLNRKESNEKLVNRNKPVIQMRDAESVSQKTINSLKNIQDPTRIQHRVKTEAELAEEELERTSLVRGFLTPTQYDFYVKILLLGSSGVGKTSLMLRFSENQFHDNLIGTAGVDFKVKYLEKKGVKTKCQLWDTSGQEKFHVITKSYYRGAHGIALVFDTTDRDSFNKLSYWIENIKTEANEEVFLILLANKIDKAGRVVTTEEGRAIAEKNGFHYFETSAKSGSNVNKAFETLANMVVEDLKKKEDRHKAKGDSLTPLRGHQHNIIPQQRKCCVIS